MKHIAWAMGLLLFLSGTRAETFAASHYAKVNGLRMYYEIHGQGQPLVLLHGGGSSIQTTFGKVLPTLAKSYQIIAIEQQGHGHTADVDRPFRFESMADDTAELLRQLKIGKADIFGFSNGGTVALLLALRHPSQVKRLVLGSAIYSLDGIPKEIRESFKKPIGPQDIPAALREDYLKNAPQPDKLPLQIQKQMALLNSFEGIPESAMKTISVPTLLLFGDHDLRLEHLLDMHRLLPHSRMAVIPGGHGAYIGEATSPSNPDMIEATLNIVKSFLAEKLP
ncbi:MAG TPA: alpha/beta hydrolase [Oligoflexus sp.]|uniref:alpha/beta fold hydrolase n=1 Tax=Oligoflexus sp. TaxID=1971216 RepID=UPI002D7EFD41|nr:alpha/beta hydrolase [Oligoflexus sp.]HET9241568.1 alpha/beta hydrolase [Oligoflexus sp.]